MRRVFDAALIVVVLPLVLPLALLGLILHALNRIVVYLLVWVWWLPSGKDVLFVSSESTVWKEYMETQVLPLVRDRATVLNWSEELRADALRLIDRGKRRWRHEPVEGDHQGDEVWQIIENMASGLGVDISDESSPLVRGLKMAARDDSPERVLVNCEHLPVSRGATGPTARQIRRIFNISTAGSKVVHCTLHNFHVEGREQDAAYAEFKRTYCDFCPDKNPRPDDWRYVGDVRAEFEAKHRDFVARLNGISCGFRFTNED